MARKRKVLQNNTEGESKRAKFFGDIIHENCVKGEKLQNLIPKLSLDLKSKVIKQVDKNQSLHQVTKTGNIEIVNEMLAFGVNPNSLNSEGLSPLHIACQKRYAKVVEELLKNGANPNLKSTNHNKSPLHYVFENEYIDEGSSINKKTISIIKCLLKYGCEIDAQTDDGESPLYAASLMGNTSAVKVLLKNGAKVTDKNNDSAMHIAAEFGSVEIIEALANHNIDVNGTGSIPITPLELAAMEGQYAAVRKLLECGADVNFTGYTDNVSALHVACEKGNLKIVKELLRFGAKTDFPESETSSPILKATIYEHLKIVKELLKHGADVDVINEEGVTALHTAAAHANVAIVKELLKYRANVNVKEINGDTALHKAIHGNIYSHYDDTLVVIQLILEDDSIDLNSRNEDNLTPLEKAIQMNDFKIGKMIAEKRFE